MKRVLLGLVVVASCSCAGLAQDKLKFDVKTATGCQDPKIISFSADVARVDACGRQQVCYYRMQQGGDRTQQLSGVGGYWECKDDK